MILLYPSANRDERGLRRPVPLRHPSGPEPARRVRLRHPLLPGRLAGPLELRLLFERLTQRVTNLRVVAGPDIEANIFVTPVTSFRLGFDVR